MLTTEAGGGDRLRERLAMVLCRIEHDGPEYCTPEVLPYWSGVADAAVAEIAAAGYCIIGPEQVADVPQDDGLLELRDMVLDFLWRVYGYPGPFADAHPVTVDNYRDDADDLLDLIESAGYEIVDSARMERLRVAAKAWFMWHRDFGGNDTSAYVHSRLEPGDLERGG